VIDLPPRVLIELRPSNVDIGGVGVFAVCAMKKEEKVADGIHAEDYATLIPWERFDTFDPDVQSKIMDFCIGTPRGFIPPEDLDFNKLSVEWYLNHSCDGNCGFNDVGDFVAIREVGRGVELTYDYGLAESNPNFIMECSCGSKGCRHKITGNDWKEPGFRAKNLKYMLPSLR
jgi:SET domain